MAAVAQVSSMSGVVSHAEDLRAEDPVLKEFLAKQTEEYRRAFLEMPVEQQRLVIEGLRKVLASDDHLVKLRMASLPAPLKEGDRFPDGQLWTIERDGSFLGKPVSYKLQDKLSGIGFLIIVTFPKGWTPTCTHKHLDDWLKLEERLARIGILLAFHTRNTHFELHQFLEARKPGYRSFGIADQGGNIIFQAGKEWGLDRAGVLGFIPSRRVSIVTDGIYRLGAHDENPGDVINTSPESFLAKVPDFLSRHSIRLMTERTSKEVEEELGNIVEELRLQRVDREKKAETAKRLGEITERLGKPKDADCSCKTEKDEKKS